MAITVPRQRAALSDRLGCGVVGLLAPCCSVRSPGAGSQLENRGAWEGGGGRDGSVIPHERSLHQKSEQHKGSMFMSITCRQFDLVEA